MLLLVADPKASSYQNQGVYPPNPIRNHGGIFVPTTNPFDPFGVPLIDQGQSLNEFGPLASHTDITTIRNVVGMILPLPHNWTIDTSFLYGESDAAYTNFNRFTVSGLNAGLNGTLPGHIGQFFDPFTDQSLHNGPNKRFYGDKQLVTKIWLDNRTEIASFNIKAGSMLVDLPSGSLLTAA